MKTEIRENKALKNEDWAGADLGDGLFLHLVY